MENKNTVAHKSKKFAVRIVKLYRYMCIEKKEFTLSKQLLRSGTSIGANIAESECAISEKDFLSKIYIALKECNETIYWIKLLYDSNFLSTREYDSIIKDCEELRRMLSSTTKTLNDRLNKQSSKHSTSSSTPAEDSTPQTSQSPQPEDSTLHSPHSTLAENPAVLKKAAVIGISGCSGSGKSTVCDLLKADGAYIIDADEVSRRVVEPGTPTLKRLADRFGEDILNDDGTLNRHLLADRAFSNEKNTKALTNITHLAILNIIVREKNANLSSYNYIILDAPLLFSSKLYRLCDLTVRVCAPKQVCISRIIKRDSITPKQAYQRLKAQTKEIKLSKKADIIIRNYSPYKLTDEIKKIF